MRIVKLDEQSKKNLLDDLLKRSPNNYTEYENTVADILSNVKKNGNQAIFEYTKKFDKADINAENIRVTENEIKEAYELIEDKELIGVIKRSKENIRAYHEKQKQYSWFDSKPDGSGSEGYCN